MASIEEKFRGASSINALSMRGPHMFRSRLPVQLAIRVDGLQRFFIARLPLIELSLALYSAQSAAGITVTDRPLVRGRNASAASRSMPFDARGNRLRRFQPFGSNATKLRRLRHP